MKTCWLSSYYEKFPDGDIRGIDDEIPYLLPSGWEWARLGCLVFNHGQITPNQPFSYIEIGSINNVDLCLNEVDNIIQANDAPSRARRLVEFGDILYSTVRPYLHNMCIVDREFSAKPIASTGLAVMACCSGLLNRYLFFYLQSPQFDLYANDGDNAKGVAYPAINDEKLYRALIPVPPTKEQYRIAEVIDSIFPALKRYNSSQSKKDELNRSIKPKLMKSILQEAIQGKLVQQDPNEEPASVLLEHIHCEKQKLLKEGKLKKNDIVDSIIYKGDDNKYYENINGKLLNISDEIPFEIPDSWSWVRLQQVCSFVHRGKSPKYSDIQKYPVIAQKCNQWDGFHIEKAQFISPESVASYSEESILQDRDLLWNSTGIGTLGRIGLYPSNKNSFGFAVADSHITVIRAMKQFVRPEYLFFFFSSPTVQSVIEDKASGSTKQKELATETIKQYLCPIPPVEEQDRILVRVNSILVSTMKTR